MSGRAVVKVQLGVISIPYICKCPIAFKAQLYRGRPQGWVVKFACSTQATGLDPGRGPTHCWSSHCCDGILHRRTRRTYNQDTQLYTGALGRKKKNKGHPYVFSWDRLGYVAKKKKKKNPSTLKQHRFISHAQYMFIADRLGTLFPCLLPPHSKTQGNGAATTNNISSGAGLVA